MITAGHLPSAMPVINAPIVVHTVRTRCVGAVYNDDGHTGRFNFVSRLLHKYFSLAAACLMSVIHGSVDETGIPIFGKIGLE